MSHRMERRSLPTSRIGRLARLAGVGARAGAGRISGAIAGEPAADAAAKAAADALGTMRGLALKLGQIASYVDGVVPDAQRDAYERAMRTLRADAPAMEPGASARVVAEELGAPPQALFAAWDDEPFASASIGQVHRARLADGREVAVKVQHEGVSRAVAADLANAGLLGTLLGPLGTRMNAKGNLAELCDGFLQELDYRREAASQRGFSELFTRLDAKEVRIPRVIDHRSAARVLTTELVAGLDFEAACAAPEDQRRRWAEILWRFVFTALLEEGRFNADPHPGNYLFGRDAVWFLDFGCTRALPPKRRKEVREAHVAAAHRHDPDALFEVACRMFDVPDDATEQRRLLDGYMRLAFAPLLATRPFKVTRGFAKQLWDEALRSTRVLTFSRHRLVPVPPEWLFFNRLQLGFYSVLARLDVEVDYGAIEREILGPP